MARALLGRLFAPGDRIAVWVIDLVRSQWELGSRLLADMLVPGRFAQDRAAVTASQRVAADAAVAADLLPLIYDTDVRDELPKVRALARFARHRPAQLVAALAAMRPRPRDVPGDR